MIVAPFRIQDNVCCHSYRQFFVVEQVEEPTTYISLYDVSHTVYPITVLLHSGTRFDALLMTVAK